MPAGSASRLVLALAAGLAAAAPLHAEFVDDYALGLHALDEGKYAEARTYLQRALEAQPNPVDKILLNGNIEQPYIPYHFIGIADYKLGDCAAANAAWDDPMNRRMVSRYYPIVREEHTLAAQCKQKAVVATKPAPVTAPAEPAAAPPAATNPPAAAPPAPATAPKAEAPAPKAEAPPVRSPQKPIVQKPPPEEKPAEAPAEPTPPPRLVRAVDSYLAGRYSEAARVDPAAFATTRARFHAYLIRAAARFTLGEIAGDKDLLAAARSDAEAAHRIDSHTAPDEALFSPRFRAFYGEAH